MSTSPDHLEAGGWRGWFTRYRPFIALVAAIADCVTQASNAANSARTTDRDAILKNWIIERLSPSSSRSYGSIAPADVRVIAAPELSVRKDTSRRIGNGRRCFITGPNRELRQHGHERLS